MSPKLLECFFPAAATEPPNLFTKLVEPAQETILGQPQTFIEALIDALMEATIEAFVEAPTDALVEATIVDGSGQLMFDCGVGCTVSHSCDADEQIIVLGSA